MSSPVSEGRMLRKDICKSKRFASLSLESQLLFCLLIPNLNAHGKMNGNIFYIKGEVVPLLDQYGTNTIARCLEEISSKTNLKWYEHDGLFYIQSINWEEHQSLRKDKLGIDRLPDYSGNSPVLVPSEVKVEGEVKEEGKDILSGKPDPIPFQKILDSLNDILKSHFKLTDKFSRLVKARWSEGFREDDFVAVVKAKANQWRGDPKMAQYLRPETLFGTKFDGYLNEKNIGRSSGTAAGSNRINEGHNGVDTGKPREFKSGWNKPLPSWTGEGGMPTAPPTEAVC